MNIKCKTCGSNDVVLSWESIMSFVGSCTFQCQQCNDSFAVPVTDVQKKRTDTTSCDCVSSYKGGVRS